MKRLLILGAGTAGTMVANKLRPRLDEREWNITIVDQDETHYYQPGFLFLPFGGYTREELERPKRTFIPDGVELIMGEIDLVVADDNVVKLMDGTELYICTMAWGCCWASCLPLRCLCRSYSFQRLCSARWCR